MLVIALVSTNLMIGGEIGEHGGDGTSTGIFSAAMVPSGMGVSSMTVCNGTSIVGHAFRGILIK